MAGVPGQIYSGAVGHFLHIILNTKIFIYYIDAIIMRSEGMFMRAKNRKRSNVA